MHAQCAIFSKIITKFLYAICESQAKKEIKPFLQFVLWYMCRENAVVQFLPICNHNYCKVKGNTKLACIVKKGFVFHTYLLKSFRY